MFVFPPTQKPTSAEYTVIVWCLSILFIVLGIIALVVAFRARPEKHVLAMLLAWRGVICIGVGFGILFLYRLIRRFID
jgi:ABC-type polysaccharide/polyol phosphate export permease